MRRVEGQVDEERLRYMPLDEIDGRVGVQIGRVFGRTILRGSLVEIVPSLIAVGVIINVAGHVADEFVKAALGRPAAGGKSDVPFAERAGGISGRLEVRGNEHLGVAQADAVIARDAGKLEV